MTTGNGNNRNGWMQYLTFVGIGVNALLVAVILPMSTRIDKLPEQFLTIREHEQFREDLHSRIDRNVRDIAFLLKEQVGREEVTKNWELNKENIAEVRKQIDDLRKDLGGQYSVAEKIKDLQSQISQLQASQLHNHDLPQFPLSK
jgi:DNA repair exonuclease SbcCD ATPase subunit